MNFDDLDPDVFCLVHGKPLLEGEYGHKAGNCDDCSPEGPTFDDALGAVAGERERMEEARLLK